MYCIAGECPWPDGAGGCPCAGEAEEAEGSTRPRLPAESWYGDQQRSEYSLILEHDTVCVCVCMHTHVCIPMYANECTNTSIDTFLLMYSLNGCVYQKAKKNCCKDLSMCCRP